MPVSNLCNLCNNKLIGDEYHYLFICSAFKIERETYLKKYYYTNPTLEKTKKFLSLNSTRHLSKLGKFLHTIALQFK